MPRTPRALRRARTTRPSPSARGRHARHGVALTGVAVLILAWPAAAHADPGATIVLAANSLPQVISNLQTWITRILLSVATLFAVISGVYWTMSGGDTATVDKAKNAFKAAVIGYSLAILAPVLLLIVRGIVGG